MLLTLLKSKIHRAAVTGASLDYEGSLTISAELAEAAGIVPYEKILVGNMANGERFETYAIYGARGRGLIELNGATAHLGKIGDRVTLLSLARLAEEEGAPHWAGFLILGAQDRIVRYEGGTSAPPLKVV